jgi:hypothetical protein
MTAVRPAADRASRRRVPACEQVARRGGGFALVVRKPVDRMSAAEAREVLATFEEHVLALRSRVADG